MRVFIENQAGSWRKHVYDWALQLVQVRDVSAAYPYPYGFVLGTRGGDGDPVDCFVLIEDTLCAGRIVECEPVALLEQVEDGAVDHKVLAVPQGGGAALTEAIVVRLQEFILRVFAHVPGKRITVGALHSGDAAEHYLMQCRVGWPS
jgi:inorganic pyrophosphatase